VSAPFSANPAYIAAALVGASRAIQELRVDVGLASCVSAPVLIAGENGVGKERLARLIHRASIRGSSPFVVVRCAELPDAMLERRLFGDGTRRGVLRRMNVGTVVLTEIGAVSPRVQDRLLDVLAPAPGCVVRPVRLISTTTCPIVGNGSNGTVNERLYYLLNTMYLQVPALRHRADDIEPLLEYFTTYYARRHGVPRRRPSRECMADLFTYDWPGNVRQLQAVAALLAVRGEPITPHELIESTALEARARLLSPFVM
jgi:DNA-binding NtrC family response regulator